MSDDYLIERLRRRHVLGITDDGYTLNLAVNPDGDEAADRIERQRAALRVATRALHRISHCSNDTPAKYMSRKAIAAISAAIVGGDPVEGDWG